MLSRWFQFVKPQACASAIGFCLFNLLAVDAHCQTEPDAARASNPPVYALVSALGDKFHIVFARQSIGSHLEPYRRTTTDIANDALNRFVLHSLDNAVAGMHPNSQRIYLELPPAQMDGVPASEREAVAIGKVVAALGNMPQRAQWDRIVVATPAYRSLDVDGMGTKLAGMGVFVQPLCQSDREHCERGFRPLTGASATTPDGKAIQASSFIASFSNVEVWVLDPKTLAVLDRKRHFDNQKVADNSAQIPDLNIAANKAYLISRISSVIDLSISEAFKSTELLGTVRVGEPRVVDPDLDKK